jgi:hypothetical protein
MSSDDSIEEIKQLMKKGDSASLEKIMDKFIVMDKNNLILRTDLENPINFTRLKLIEETMKGLGLKKSSKSINTFLEWYIKSRVPYKRQSWKYIFGAIGELKKQSQQSIGSLLTGFGKNKDDENQ